jgi:fido (protein-threonine AMPylation protein)
MGAHNQEAGRGEVFETRPKTKKSNRVAVLGCPVSRRPQRHPQNGRIGKTEQHTAMEQTLYLDFDEDIPYTLAEAQQTSQALQGYWDAAIGLQDVDGIKPSAYLLEVAERNIKGELSYSEVETLLKDYYAQRGHEAPSDEREADFASARIAHILALAPFSLDAQTLQDYNRMIFEGIRSDAGSWKTADWIKPEPILYGDSVSYGSKDRVAQDLTKALDCEKDTPYIQMDEEYVIQRLSALTSDIWRIHPFNEGNTRTTAAFIARYLKTLGFTIDNAMFRDHSRYFRNALVRDNYQNLPKKVARESIYLRQFFGNLLYGKKHELKNRHLHVRELAPADAAQEEGHGDGSSCEAGHKLPSP